MSDVYDAYGERLAFLTFANIRNKHILDIGAGKGVSAVIAVQEFNNTVTMIDPFPQQIEKAQKNITENNIEKEVDLLKVDITDNFLENDSYDWVICYNALHHIPEEKRLWALKEMYRIGKIGFVISELNDKGVQLFDTEVHPDSDHSTRKVSIEWLEKCLKGLGNITQTTHRALTNFYKLNK